MAKGDDPLAGDPLEIVRAVYDGWSRGNLWAEAERWDPQVVYIPPREDVDQGPFHGLEELTAYMQRFLSMWKSWQIEAVQYRQVGDNVLAKARRVGVGKESGVRIEDEVFQLWTIRDGRIVRFEVIADEGEALAAVGVGFP